MGVWVRIPPSPPNCENDMNELVKEACEKYSAIEIDGVYYIFQKELDFFVLDYYNSGWMTKVLATSDFVYTREKCIRNRLIDLETADFVYKTMGRLIISEKDLQNAKSDIKELVNKVL